MEVCRGQLALSSKSPCVAHLDQWSDVLVLNGTLATDLVETSTVRTVSHGLILEIALASLVANRAVERVVREEEFHNTFSRLVDERRVGLHNHSWLDRPRTGCNGLGGPFHLN